MVRRAQWRPGSHAWHGGKGESHWCGTTKRPDSIVRYAWFAILFIISATLEKLTSLRFPNEDHEMSLMSSCKSWRDCPNTQHIVDTQQVFIPFCVSFNDYRSTWGINRPPHCSLNEMIKSQWVVIAVGRVQCPALRTLVTKVLLKDALYQREPMDGNI